MPYLLFVLCCLFPLWIVFHSRKKTKQAVAHIRAKKKNQGEMIKMLKLLETLIGKRCAVHTIDNDYEGVVEKVEDNWIVLKERYYDSLAFINPEYVVGVVECKEKKNKEKQPAQEQTAE